MGLQPWIYLGRMRPGSGAREMSLAVVASPFLRLIASQALLRQVVHVDAGKTRFLTPLDSCDALGLPDLLARVACDRR